MYMVKKEVMHDNRLKPNAKLLWGYLASLTPMVGDKICTVTNKELAEVFNTSQYTISRWVSSLVECGYIEIRQNVGYYREIRVKV